MSDPHRCDERCVCPTHQTPLLWWPAGKDHACQDADCEYSHGLRFIQAWHELHPPGYHPFPWRATSEGVFDANGDVVPPIPVGGAS